MAQSEKTCIVSDIQKFCVHDGPGIRTTVFLKGCPIHCSWCHNPETQNFEKELLHNPERCGRCGRCMGVCPEKAISVTESSVVTDLNACSQCETCLDYCIAEAREWVGSAWGIEALVQEIAKDKPFYETSGGGVTFSGGEALCQADAVEEAAKGCKEAGISVVVDTCGAVPYEAFEKVLPYTDLFLYDVKLVDSESHRQETGLGNELILANLKRLSEAGAAIQLRLPLIVGINAEDAHIEGVLKLLEDVRVSGVNLLPYHDTGSFKYRKLNRGYDASRFSAPDDSWLEGVADRFRQAGYLTKIGG